MPSVDELGHAKSFSHICNEAQTACVASIVHGLHGSSPFVIYGPPGTGKTMVVCESIKMLRRNDRKSRIIVLTPSNTAADHIVERLASDNRFDKRGLIRVMLDSLSPGKFSHASVFECQ
jgi:superfamily II DNA or RNA helicase